MTLHRHQAPRCRWAVSTGGPQTQLRAGARVYSAIRMLLSIIDIMTCPVIIRPVDRGGFRLSSGEHLLCKRRLAVQILRMVHTAVAGGMGTISVAHPYRAAPPMRWSGEGGSLGWA
jgi:hypothetical protein